MSEVFEGWAVLELMGHRQRPGFVKEVEIAGGKMLRVDIPCEGGDVTEFYATTALYSLRPVTEEIARDLARHMISLNPPQPAKYRALAPPSNSADYDDDDDDSDDDDQDQLSF